MNIAKKYVQKFKKLIWGGGDLKGLEKRKLTDSERCRLYREL